MEGRVYYHLKRRKALKYFDRLREVELPRGGKDGKVLTYQVELVRKLERMKKGSLLDGVYVLAANLVARGERGEFLVSAFVLCFGSFIECDSGVFA